MHCHLQSERRRRKIDFHGTLASYLHYTLKHDVLVVDCDYQSRYACCGANARWVPSEPQKAAFSDGRVQQNAGDGNPQDSPSGDSHGLAYFHLRR